MRQIAALSRDRRLALQTASLDTCHSDIPASAENNRRKLRTAMKRIKTRMLPTTRATAPAAPAGKVLVHNNFRPTRRLGSRGFRAWLIAANDDRHGRKVCDCGFAPELGTHYRVVLNGF
jgi:hypothetical protein